MNADACPCAGAGPQGLWKRSRTNRQQCRVEDQKDAVRQLERRNAVAQILAGLAVVVPQSRPPSGAHMQTRFAYLQGPSLHRRVAAQNFSNPMKSLCFRGLGLVPADLGRELSTEDPDNSRLTFTPCANRCGGDREVLQKRWYHRGSFRPLGVTAAPRTAYIHMPRISVR